MMNRITVLILIALAAAACNSGYKKTDTGLQYKFLKEPGKGRKARGGDFVLMEYTMQSGDSLLISTYNDPDLHVLELPEELPLYNELVQAILMMGEGDSARFKLSSDSLEIKTGWERPPFVKPGALLTVTIALKRVMSGKEYQQYTWEDYIEKRQRVLEQFTAYATEKGLTFTVDSTTGIRYHISSPGDGLPIRDGQRISMHITGKVIGGEYDFLNTYMEGRRMELELGKDYQPPALQHMPKYLKDGESGIFLVPFDMGYGKAGRYGVPPYANLVFEIKDIRIQ
jgi:FKBP-type peptidyl-prolyl cis-trans isomerase FkpA